MSLGVSIPNIVHADEALATEYTHGKYWRGSYQSMTLVLDQLPGPRLGMNLNRVAGGHSVCPFNAHAREDEVFYILSGRGILCYDDGVYEIQAGDCISCPAGTGVAHQLANPFEQELVHLAVGLNDPDEVCTYPDSGKVYIRRLNKVGRLEATEYMAGKPDLPQIFELWAAQSSS